MDNLKQKLALAIELAKGYFEKAKAFIATKIGKVVIAAFLVGALVYFIPHRAKHPDPVPTPIACPDIGPSKADDLAIRLSKSEEAQARLQKKVSDYEKQLAKHSRKTGAFILSPADARSLSNDIQ